ncbi:TetR/AcrR family transcriptional regulator [Novosphingobium sp.]|uniref:TetR/AcrR family transcriptional regulator n=1 Tax=Novosphingobium sp. TaxID=1874826 RepID=UPI002FDF4C0A
MKPDSRRQAILDTAIELFREVGYERASMAAIAARVGGSKGTLYNYFKNKDDLFAAAMIGAMEEQGMEIMERLKASVDDVRTVLLRFGVEYLTFITSADNLAIVRTAVAEGSNARLGAQLYELGPQRGTQEITAFIAPLQAQGKLRPAPPQIAAAHLRGLLEAGIFEPRLFGAASDYAIEDAVEAAVDAFLRAYGCTSSA